MANCTIDYVARNLLIANRLSEEVFNKLNDVLVANDLWPSLISFEGLEHKVKSLESALLKMNNTCYPEGVKTPTKNFELYDLLRFTIIYRPDKDCLNHIYNYVKTLHDSSDFVVTYERNTRCIDKQNRVGGYGDIYYTINYTGNTIGGENGFPFELQFHTELSLESKEIFYHPLYELWRKNPDNCDPFLKMIEYTKQNVDVLGIRDDVKLLSVITGKPLKCDLIYNWNTSANNCCRSGTHCDLITSRGGNSRKYTKSKTYKKRRKYKKTRKYKKKRCKKKTLRTKRK